jgi:hypothetical protein
MSPAAVTVPGPWDRRRATRSIGDTDKDRSACPFRIQHRRSANHTLRIVCPNGHLGFAPIKTGGFRIGCSCEPDLICADSGSCDVGPVPLGSATPSSPLQWQIGDLETILLASRHPGVPMIVGSAGDTGSNSRVDLFVGIIQDLAKKHRLALVRVGYFYSEVSKDALRPAHPWWRHDHGSRWKAAARSGHLGRDRARRRDGRDPPLHQAP